MSATDGPGGGSAALDRIRAHAAARPAAPAVEHGDRVVGYGELAAAVDERLRSAPGRVAPGGVVPLTRPRSVDWVVDLLAVLAAGGIAAPTDPGLPRPRRQAQHEALVALGPQPEPAGGYVFFTSGTTGVPRPVLSPATGIPEFMAWQSAEFALGPGGRVGFLTPLSFDVCIRDVFLALWPGGTLVVPAAGEATTPESTVEWLLDRRVEMVDVTPSVAAGWLRHGRARCPDLRLGFAAGEPLTARLVADWFAFFPGATELVNFYGTTETAFPAFAHRIHRGDRPVDPVPVGAPVPPGRAVLIADADPFDAATVRRRRAEPRADGEIVLVSRRNSHGYAGMPAETAVRFLGLGDGETAYRTGDLGWWDAAGRLVVSGRADDEVTVGGTRIHPAEVAAALRSHPAVADAYVLGAAVPGRTARRNRARPASPRAMEAMTRSQDGSPTPAQPKSSTACTRPSRISTLSTA